MNFKPGRSGIANQQHLLEQAETRTEKFLPVRERVIVNAQSLDGAGIPFPIVKPALPASVPRRAHVIFSSLVAVLLKVLPGMTQRYLNSTTLCI